MEGSSLCKENKTWAMYRYLDKNFFLSLFNPGESELEVTTLQHWPGVKTSETWQEI